MASHPRIKRNRIVLREDEIANRDRYRVKGKLDNRPFETRYTMNHDQTVLSRDSYGPYSRTIERPWVGGSGPRSFYDSQNWNRTKTKKNRTPLPYDHLMGRITGATPGTYPDAVSGGAGYTAYTGMPSIDSLASNKARARFVSEMRDKATASLAVTLVEWEQSSKMIALRAAQLLKMLNAFKTGNLSKVQDLLQTNRQRSRLLTESSTVVGLPRGIGAANAERLLNGRLSEAKKRKLGKQIRQGSISIANVILETAFGWMPMIDDMFKACEVLASNPPAGKVVGRGSARHEDQGSRTSSGYPYYYVRSSYLSRCHIQAIVHVDNPNLALANQLGLINPVATAWSVIPFTFLVDRYLLPVAQFLNSFSDLLGYRLDYAFTTTTRKVDEYREYHFSGPGISDWNSSIGWRHTRNLGIPPARLVTRDFNGFTPSEALTNISLLIQNFLKVR